jgi:tetratricopeptide (TPR) repeat protein
LKYKYLSFEIRLSLVKNLRETLEKPEKKRYSANMRILILLFLFTAGFGLWAESTPEWMLPLREAIYEQKLNADDVKPLHQAAKTAAQEHFAGAALDLALSRCEYFMGRALQYEKRDNEASIHYSEGMRLAEKAVAASPSAAAWVMLSENLSQNCAVRSTAYAISNGLDVDKYAKNALALNKRNAAAQIIVAARWVYAPAPLHNHKRGIQMMEAIISEGDMEKDDQFNVYSAIAYAYIQQKKYAEARPWLLKALEVYPTNKYAAELLAKK